MAAEIQAQLAKGLQAGRPYIEVFNGAGCGTPYSKYLEEYDKEYKKFYNLKSD